MNLQIESYKDFNDLLSAFPDAENLIKQRLEFYEKAINQFLISNGYTDYVVLNTILLHRAIIDYFTDVIRIKNFHNIDFTNDVKIYAYSAYWFLRRRPIQIKSSTIPEDKAHDITYINECFIYSMLLRFLVGDDIDKPIIPSKRAKYHEFANTLLYYLKYRKYDAQSIEILLLAHEAGRAFQYSIDHMK